MRRCARYVQCPGDRPNVYEHKCFAECRGSADQWAPTAEDVKRMLMSKIIPVGLALDIEDGHGDRRTECVIFVVTDRSNGKRYRFGAEIGRDPEEVEEIE